MITATLQLCFSTSDEIVKISMIANTVEDPNQDPNLYCEIDVITAQLQQVLKGSLIEKEYKIYPNPFSDEIYIENLLGNEYFIIYDFLRRMLLKENV